jgi:putative ABC transport system permease protein
MFKNYLKIAWRALGRNRVSAIINIGGLAIGMAVAMLIGLWIWDELSFNKGIQNYKTIAQVMQNQTFNGEVQTWGSQAMQLGPELRNHYGSNFRHVVLSSFTNDHLLGYGDKKLVKTGDYMEPEITGMLALKMLKGSRAGLNDLNSIFLSASVAKALLGDADPMGKIVTVDNKLPVKVTGVYEDLPGNSSFSNLSFIAPFQLMVKSEKFVENNINWGNSWFRVFVQIADNTTMQAVSAHIKDSKLKGVLKAGDDDDRFKPEIFLFPMSRWNLYGDFKNGANNGGKIQYVWLYGVIGAFVLLLACINFMNLSTARSQKRAREVGIRKTIGSLRRQLIGQFFSESLMVALMAFIIAIVLAQLSLPFFNEVAGKIMNIKWSEPLFWLLCIGFCIITGLIAGSYPALYLSSFKPVKVLKGTFKPGRFATVPRKALVVVQFTVSVIMIVGTIIVFRQIQYAKNRPIGYNNNGLISIPVKTDAIRNHYNVFRNELLQTGVVTEVAGSQSPITNVYVTNSGYKWEGKDPQMNDDFSTVAITHEFGNTTGWQIVQGRDFSKELISDSAGLIINESAVKYMGLKNPLGVQVKRGPQENYTIIGVVKNMVMQWPYGKVRQMFFFLGYDRIEFINVKVDPQAGIGDALSKIQAIYKKFDADNPFEYKFSDQEYAKKFGNEERIGKLAGFFTLLAIFISCLGLFGLASFVAEQRTKEIGVRKVLGASVFNVWRLLSKEFFILVSISLLIAVPSAYYFMYNWLQNYTYRTDISWWVFLLAGISALGVTLLTISYQSIKAALMNPVKSLRTE